MIKFVILSLFPEMFNNFLSTSVVKRSIEKDKLKVDVLNIRDFSLDKFKRVDFTPYGGGSGMVMSVEPIARAIDYSIDNYTNGKYKIIYMSPRGKVLNYNLCNEISKNLDITYIVLCGHYEGIDERVIIKYNITEISIGDYVLTGGELPAMVLIDSTVRLVKDVISEGSLIDESHTNKLLEYGQYTKPAEYEGMKVPEVLLSGNHENIKKFRDEESLKITLKNRPDLLKNNNIV